jgi:hypothetical protein
LQSNFAVLTSHVSARLGSRQENSAARLPERIFLASLENRPVKVAARWHRY